MNENTDIKVLIQRFFDGDSTPGEEAALYSWFAANPDAGEFERFRPLFGWFEALPRQNADSEAVPERKPRRRRWLAAASIALAVAAASFLALMLADGKSAPADELYAQYRGSYVMKDGKRITDIEAIYGELIRAQATVDSLAAAAEKADRDLTERLRQLSETDI